MNRRKFLTILGSTGVASALGTATVAKGAGTVTYPYHDDSFGVLHDTTRCIGCRRCEQACQEVNNLPKPDKAFDDLNVLNTKRRTSADAWTVVNKYTVDGKDVFRKLQCYHCNDPACASACFAKCFKKETDGTVSYDGSRCVGCRYCMIACPFYIPGFQYYEAYNPLIGKCTFCRPRLLEGKLPGCVESCPMDALTFGKRKDLVKIARARIVAKPERYVDYIYGEYDAGGTAWITLSGVPSKEVGFNMKLGNRPMGELTAGALGSVPMIIGFWPVLFAGVYGITKLKERVNKEDTALAVKKANEDARSAMEAAIAKVEQTQGKDVADQVKQAFVEEQKNLDNKEHGKSSKPGEGA